MFDDLHAVPRLVRGHHGLLELEQPRAIEPQIVRGLLEPCTLLGGDHTVRQRLRAPRVDPGPAPAAGAAGRASAPLRSEPAPGPTPDPPAASAPASVLLEPPYSALGHPRLATEMLTLGRDDELFQWALGGSADPV